jgi:signal transduction histidine kinase
MMNDAAQQLTEIFDRLKLVSQINDMDILSTQVDIQGILRMVKDRIKFIEGYHEIEIQEDIQDFDWDSDPILIEMIIQNLMENSVRFRKTSDSAQSFIKIAVRPRNGMACISVSDNGIGIKDDQIQHIYQMFSKAARNHQTMGLGLYIVRQAAEKLNGTVTLKQNAEGLTEFEVCIPLATHPESIYSPVHYQF